MKKILLGGLALIACAGAGCNKFLQRQENLTDFVSSTTFYKTPTQIDEALSGVYATLRSLYSAGGNYWGMTEMSSDNTTFEYNNQDRGSLELENMDYFMVTTDNNYLLASWTSLYNTVSQCNGVLDNINNASYTDADAKNEAIGQAEFIRALAYFNLVRLWGSVPLVTHQVTTPAKAYNAQASVDSIYAQITSDAEDAAAKLPAQWPSESVGRATKGAANTLLGEVYLTLKNFPAAIKALQSVTGYSLVPDYASLYNPGNKNSSESIFEIQYSAAIQGQASNYLYYFAPLYSGFATIGSFDPNSGSGRNLPTRDLLAAYEKGDKRKSASITWFVDPLNVTNGYVEAQHDSVPYINKYAAKPAVTNEQDNDFYIYRYADVLLWLSEASNEVDGPTATAYGYINQVRQRAGLGNLTSGLSQDAFRQAVYHEERIEEAFEDHRWFQLVRTGQMVSVMTKNGAAQKAYQTWLPATSYSVQPYMLLYPIPVNEATLNNLTQNPGWH